jgi:signal transduction histidine kinase
MSNIPGTKPVHPLVVRLIGDPSTVSLEHRILNAIMLLVFLTGLFSTVQNIVFGNAARMIIATLACAAGGFAGYRLSFTMRSWRILLVPIYAFFLLLLSGCWITQAGSDGTVGYYYFLAITFSVVLFNGTAKVVALLSGVANIAVLLLIEFFYPSRILPYPTPELRFADVAFSMVLCLCMTAVMVYVVYSEYQRERRAKDLLLRQVTEEKEMVERSMREKQRLLSIVCHDIANALTVLKCSVSLMKIARRANQASDQESIDRVSFAAGNIDEIVNSVRMMEAVEQGRLAFKLDPVDLRSVIRNSEIIFADRLAQRRMRLDLPPASDLSVKVLAEPKILANHVFNNLLSNAIKFSHSGSVITIRIENHGMESAIIVTDHGIGIPADLMDRLFDLDAKTTRPGTDGEPGTGFGMLTVKSFIDLFGGRIEVVSRSQDTHPGDHGTTVSVFLKNAAG